MRYGTRTVLGRGWTPTGIRPRGRMHIGYKYHYLYVALSPRSGDVFALLLPRMNSKCYTVFLKEFSRHLSLQGLIGDGMPEVRFIADNAGFHHAKDIDVPAGISAEHIPPYSPELNPCERFFEEIRRSMKNKVAETVEEIEQVVIGALRHYWDNPDAVIQLTYWEWMGKTICTTS